MNHLPVHQNWLMCSHDNKLISKWLNPSLSATGQRSSWQSTLSFGSWSTGSSIPTTHTSVTTVARRCLGNDRRGASSTAGSLLCFWACLYRWRVRRGESCSGLIGGAVSGGLWVCGGSSLCRGAHFHPGMVEDLINRRSFIRTKW